MMYKLSKLLYLLFLIYMGWFQAVFFPVPMMPIILGGGMVILLILSKLTSRSNNLFVIPKPIIIWFIFFVYIVFSGIIVAYNYNQTLKSAFSFMQNLILIFFVVNVTNIDDDNSFFIKSYLGLSILIMITMLSFGYIGGGERIRLSVTTNPNGDALMLLYGVFCSLILIKERKLLNFIFTTGLIGLFIYTIILTGSRKSVVAVLMLLIL
ncbi:hypothetical protein, partial [Alkalibacterium sp. 20]|uniref:hypothetical protein n=1 Tax=Alkalibacterium sp. 20 TaxID=1798803 RepID=UPI001160505E